MSDTSVDLAVSRDTFLDRTMSKNSRRNFLNQIEKRKYEMNSTVNVDKEAEAEIDQMVNDARKKLDFHSILGKNKNDAKSRQKIKGHRALLFLLLNHTEKRCYTEATSLMMMRIYKT